MIAEYIACGLVSAISVGCWLGECSRNRRLNARYNGIEESYVEEQKKVLDYKEMVSKIISQRDTAEIAYGVERALRETRKEILDFQRRCGDSELVDSWKRIHRGLEERWVDRTSQSNGLYVTSELKSLQIAIIEEKIRREEANKRAWEREQQRKRKYNVGNSSKAIDFKVCLDKLGLAPSVRDLNTIKKQYRRLMMKYHPDNQDTGDTKKAQEINDAMDKLEKLLG